jgi:hypothetical protein
MANPTWFYGTGIAVYATSTNSNAVEAHSFHGGVGVFGVSNEQAGVAGRSEDGYRVEGISQNGWGGVHGAGYNHGVHGESWGENGYGVLGESWYDAGVAGRSTRGIGVYGRSRADRAVFGLSEEGIGVVALSYSDHLPALIARGPLAGTFVGRVDVDGDLNVLNGNKTFKIDHPLDPGNKYLSHNTVESPERKNVYDGVAELGTDGTASVELPGWFEALNGDFRYQLTAVGQAAPDLHVAEEIYENSFKIAGGQAGVKVCWQVTGTRKDPWAEANPFEVEEEKPEEERGRYLQPSLYGAPEEQSVMRARMGMTREPQPQQFEPPEAPPMPPGAPPMPEGFIPTPTAFVGLEEENRRQIDELKRQIEELRRERLEEEIDELRGQVKKLKRRRKR